MLLFRPKQNPSSAQTRKAEALRLLPAAPAVPEGGHPGRGHLGAGRSDGGAALRGVVADALHPHGDLEKGEWTKAWDGRVFGWGMEMEVWSCWVQGLVRI